MRARIVTLALVAAGSVGGGLAARALRKQAGKGVVPADRSRSRWQAVTVNRPPEEVLPDGRLPTPLAELGDLVEVAAVPAGSKGTELRARLRGPEPSADASPGERWSGDDPRQRVRSALREAKQLLEVGEVLRVDPAPHGRRSRLPAGRLVELATRRAGGEGVL